MTTDAAAVAAEIPGLVLRPYAGEADLPDIVRVQNAEWEADGVRGRTSLDEVRAYFSQASDGFDPARDVRLAELDGRVVAVSICDWADTTDGLREHRTRGYVVPEGRRRGIGTALLLEGQASARAVAVAHPADRPILGLFTNEHNAGAAALAERFGYAPVRWFFDMERRIDGGLPDIGPLPGGLEIRPVGREHAKAIWEADHEAFQDHWGGHDPSEANFRRWVDSPEFSPELFVVAWDGDEIAAAVLNAVYPEENEELGIQRGWLDSVFTRRRWRRMGLARELIARSLHLLRERGLTSAALGVDADNPSGALGLYESAGFEVTERMTAWRRPMEAGATPPEAR